MDVGKDVRLTPAAVFASSVKGAEPRASRDEPGATNEITSGSTVAAALTSKLVTVAMTVVAVTVIGTAAVTTIRTGASPGLAGLIMM